MFENFAFFIKKTVLSQHNSRKLEILLKRGRGKIPQVSSDLSSYSNFALLSSHALLRYFFLAAVSHYTSFSNKYLKIC